MSNFWATFGNNMLFQYGAWSSVQWTTHPEKSIIKIALFNYTTKPEAVSHWKNLLKFTIISKKINN